LTLTGVLLRTLCHRPNFIGEIGCFLALVRDWMLLGVSDDNMFQMTTTDQKTRVILSAEIEKVLVHDCGLMLLNIADTGNSFPDKLDFVQKCLSIKSNFVICMKGSLRAKTQSARDLSSSYFRGTTVDNGPSFV
jgi:hypothetical protein